MHSQIDPALELGRWEQQFAVIRQHMETLKQRLAVIRGVDPKLQMLRPNKPIGRTPLYSRVVYTFNPVGPRFRSNLVKDLRQSCRKHGIRQIVYAQGKKVLRFNNPSFSSFKGVPETVLFAAKAISQANYRGFELDTILQDTSGRYWAITVTNNFNRIEVKAVRNPKLFRGRNFKSIGAGKAYIEDTYRGIRLKETTSRWNIFQLQSLDLALSKLSPGELRNLQGLVFERVKSVAERDPRRAAIYKRFNNIAVIRVGDNAVERKSSFIGEPESPILLSSMVFLHEIAHAIASRYILESHEVFIRWQQQRKIFDVIKGRLSNQQVDLLRTVNPFDLVSQQEFSQFSERNPILAKYASIPDVSNGPTRYGRVSISESFAESFALYHLDPKALIRVSPGAYKFFESQGHLIMEAK
ncbi:hypothetical protein [Pseudobacteriovorax antillogorgiicola]|uniref:hypothetical protein n=1 Tax=Pseudobacteriovorax antillogorgiicola TaxID=1513793 RepID=UPI00105110EB|nr:hypothetical protein [Pseudobacteriovorax antillogorgiicola]